MSGFQRAQFQEAAVQRIVARLRDHSGSRRMLLADEVGLGKTIVARGVIEHLTQESPKPLTVIYLCSNAEIAEQNRRKLDPNSERPISRVTQLAMHRPVGARLHLYSFTPGTSLKAGTGLAWERRLLMYLLYRAYGLPVWREPYREFFRCGVGCENWCRATEKHKLSENFARKTTTGFQARLATAWRAVDCEGRSALQAVREMAPKFDLWDPKARKRRNHLVGRLREEMQRVVLRDLDPDLVVLDEVQRFKEVLDEAANAKHIAAELFEQRAPVLILSATPYRALTLGHEVTEGESSHHVDFFRTLDFLFDPDTETPDRIGTGLKKFGERLRKLDLLDLTVGSDEELQGLKTSLEEDLTKVICRTERNWYVLDQRKGVDDVSGRSGVLPGRAELEEYFRLYRTLASRHSMGQVTEFWKSAPSLLTFMDSKYALLRKLRDERVRVPRALLTSGAKVKSLSNRNHRIARVVEISLGEDGTPPRLWIAPAYSYYRDELFGDAPPRKVLTFSGWRFVPKTVAIVGSGVAADRLEGTAEENTQPLRFTERRSFHTFDACLSVPSLADIGDVAYRTHRGAGQRECRAKDILAAATQELRRRLPEAGVDVTATGGDPIWQVAMRLETHRDGGARMRAALGRWGTGTGRNETSDHEAQHCKWTKEWLDDRSRLRVSEARLQRLALVAAFSPANCVLRAIDSVFPHQTDDETLPRVVALCLGPLRRYFNRPHVQRVIRRHRFRRRWNRIAAKAERGYTQRVLVYAADAHFQAVMDEYVYLLRHATEGESVDDVIDQLANVWGLSQGTPRANGAHGTGEMVLIKPEAEAHTTHFAQAFGKDVTTDGGIEGETSSSVAVRKSVVRRAFNSPFWPFVLATTSVGQEGLDFHLYCRDVMHWNLPSNPVDLEQREGRVNRRDCLAVRQSIARDWPLAQLDSRSGGPLRNPWTVVFDVLKDHDDVQRYKHGLFPHWVYECQDPERTVHIQRHVPYFSTSRDAAKYERLKVGLALYRLVFGQVNQEDLLDDLQEQLGELDEDGRRRILRRLSSYMLNLSPVRHTEAVKGSQEEADDLLAGQPRDGIEKLLEAIDRLRRDRPDDLEPVSKELDFLLAYVRSCLAAGDTQSGDVRTAVAALAYLRNPYDHVFDLHVEGGFDDDIAELRKAYALLA